MLPVAWKIAWVKVADDVAVKIIIFEVLAGMVPSGIPAARFPADEMPSICKLPVYARLPVISVAIETLSMADVEVFLITSKNINLSLEAMFKVFCQTGFLASLATNSEIAKPAVWVLGIRFWVLVPVVVVVVVVLVLPVWPAWQ